MKLSKKNGRKHFRVSNNKLYIKFPDDTDKGWYPAGTLINEFKGLLGATYVKPETPLNRLVKKASEIVGEPLYLHECGRDEFALKRKGTEFTYFVFHAGLTFSFNTRWSMFHGLSSSKRKQLIEAVTEYYQEVGNDL